MSCCLVFYINTTVVLLQIFSTFFSISEHKFLLLNFIGFVGLLIVLLSTNNRIITSIQVQIHLNFSNFHYTMIAFIFMISYYFQIQTIDGRLALLNSKSEYNALNPPHIEVDSQHLTIDPINPQFQRTFLKAGLLINRLPDSQVKFEPNAVSTFIELIVLFYHLI